MEFKIETPKIFLDTPTRVLAYSRVNTKDKKNVTVSLPNCKVPFGVEYYKGDPGRPFLNLSIEDEKDIQFFMGIDDLPIQQKVNVFPKDAYPEIRSTPIYTLFQRRNEYNVYPPLLKGNFIVDPETGTYKTHGYKETQTNELVKLSFPGDLAEIKKNSWVEVDLECFGFWSRIERTSSFGGNGTGRIKKVYGFDWKIVSIKKKYQEETVISKMTSSSKVTRFPTIEESDSEEEN